MGSDKAVKVGLIGCGTVGTGVVRLFKEQNPSDISLEAVVVAHPEKDRQLHMPNLTGDIGYILDNKSIDIVVELMGGYQPAFSYVMRAIQKGKHVVFANKANLSEYGPDIFAEAAKHNVNVAFEGAVGGGIP